MFMLNTGYSWKTVSNICKSAPIKGYKRILIELTSNVSSEDLHKYLNSLSINQFSGYSLYMFDCSELDKNLCTFYKRFGDKVLYAINTRH